MTERLRWSLLVLTVALALSFVHEHEVLAQPGPTADGKATLTVATVTREPFSFVKDGQETGFSIDLLRMIASEVDFDIKIKRVDTFSEMLSLVETSKADLAIANISITAEREKAMDFSHPMFDSGLQIMLPKDEQSSFAGFTVLAQSLGAPLMALLFLALLAGLVMWVFESKIQPFFSRPLSKSLFSSFWWALRTIVNNGGWDDEVPKTLGGRFLATILIIFSLLFVSIFTAYITTQMTISAIESSVQSINDLHKRQVGTTLNSTASAWLSGRDIAHDTFDSTDELFAAFEAKQIDAVFFDGPILAYYAMETSQGEVLAPVYSPTPYGIAAVSGSPYIEQINTALLGLKESGAYSELESKYFQ